VATVKALTSLKANNRANTYEGAKFSDARMRVELPLEAGGMLQWSFVKTRKEKNKRPKHEGDHARDRQRMEMNNWLERMRRGTSCTASAKMQQRDRGKTPTTGQPGSIVNYQVWSSLTLQTL
jgi:hypothetical protein